VVRDLAEKRAIIRSVMGRVLGVDAAQIDDAAVLGRDIPADSLMVLEVALSLEKRFNIVIPESDYSKLVSVEQICQRINELEEEHSASPPSF